SMVLQRDSKLKIWGWAKPGEKIVVSFLQKKYRTAASETGDWSVILSPAKAGGPYTMSIDASNHIVLKDILLGDVWFCSGQSNMVHQLNLHKERYEKDIAAASNSMIRHFWIPTVSDPRAPRKDLPAGSWKSANPTDVLQFSAVAYFFACKIYDQYKVPVGLINASVGGSPIEAWTSEDGLRSFPEISNSIKRNRDSGYIADINRKASEMLATAPKPADKGLLSKPAWYDPAYIPKGWRKITVPGYWEDQGAADLNGIVWYRKEINVAASMAGMPVKVALGRIVDADALYINGRQVGNTTYQYPQRRYMVPAGVLREGKNLLVVRVTNNSEKGGFVPDKPYYISNNSD
ncbi:MAG: sialate O-acetylesterase, partial [Sphingobacteriales bacterium]